MTFDLDRINQVRADLDRPRISRDQAEYALSQMQGRIAQAAGELAVDHFLIGLALPADRIGTAAVDAALGKP